MAKSLTRKINRDVQDAATDISHAISRAAPRLREDGQEAVAEGARRVRVAARDLAGRARTQSKSVAIGAVRQAKARPVAAGAILAAIAALIGLAIARRPART